MPIARAPGGGRDGPDRRAGPRRRPRRVEDYEAILAPIYAWIRALAERLDPTRGGHLHTGSVRGWQALTGARPPRPAPPSSWPSAIPVAIAGAQPAGLGPLRADLSGPALRRAGLRGVEEVLARLGVRRRYVIFGHTHRAGPLPADDRRRMASPPRGDRLLNTGCWVQEPSFIGRDPRGARTAPASPSASENEGRPSWSTCSTTEVPVEVVPLMGGRTLWRQASPGVKHTAWHSRRRRPRARARRRCCARGGSARRRPGRRPRSSGRWRVTVPSPSSTAHTPPAS